MWSVKMLYLVFLDYFLKSLVLKWTSLMSIKYALAHSCVMKILDCNASMAFVIAILHSSMTIPTQTAAVNSFLF